MRNYVIDSLEISRAYEDSIFNSTPLFLGKDAFVIIPEYNNYTKNKSLTIQGEDGHEGIKRPFTLEGDDGIFALLLICFVFFTRIFKGGFSFFKENISLLFSTRKNLNLFSETTTTEFWFNFILVFQTILLTSIIVFDSFLESVSYIPQNSFFTVLLFTLAISVFLSVKYLFYRLLGYLFDLQNEIKAWLRSYMIVLEMIGIIAFIPALMLVYSQSFHEYLLFFFFILFFISRLILFYRIITFFLRRHVNLLFLITYLCSVEIIPYILLYQVLVYLYKVDIVSLLWL